MGRLPDRARGIDPKRSGSGRAALGIDVGMVSILSVGLAFFAGAFLVELLRI
jgi:hypothetical protein